MFALPERRPTGNCRTLRSFFVHFYVSNNYLFGYLLQINNDIAFPDFEQNMLRLLEQCLRVRSSVLRDGRQETVTLGEVHVN